MRFSLRLSAVVALLLAVATVTVASASSAGGSSDDDVRGKVEVIRVIGRDFSRAFLDLDRSGGDLTLGDQSIFSSDFFQGDEKIAFDGGFCTLVRLPALFQCVATNSLPKGQITAQGLLDFAEAGPFRLAITGGTEKYRTAHGEVEVVIREGDDLVTFRIIR